LKSGQAIRTIVDTLDISSEETVLEIGSGHGELTTAILNARPAKLICVEKDPVLAAELEKEHRSNPDVKVIRGDVLRVVGPLARELTPPYKIVGNIPYYLTGHLLRLTGELETKPELSVLMLQKEVAERLAAKPPRMNRLAASVQFWALPRVVRIVPRSEFSPPPKVDSAIVEFVTKQSTRITPLRLGYFRAVQTLFRQPRKTILNNILFAIADSKKLSKDDVEKLLTNIGIDPQKRAQILSVEDISRIANLFFSP